MKRIQNGILLLAATVIIFSCDIFSIFPPQPSNYFIDFEDDTFGILEPVAGEWEIATLTDGNKAARPSGEQFVSDMYFRGDLGENFSCVMDFNISTLEHREIPNLGFYYGEEYINLLVTDGILKLHTGDNPDNYAEGKETALSLSLQTWYTLEVRVSNGSDFQILLDENEIMSHSFSGSMEFDKIIYWAYPGVADILIDNVSIDIER